MLMRTSYLLKAFCLTVGAGTLVFGASAAMLLIDGDGRITGEELRKVEIIQHSALRPQKQTPSALYLTSEQAYSWLEDDPDVLFVDVRDPLEASLMGHPKNIDAIVPVRVFSDQFDPAIQEYKLVDNPDFIKRMDEVLEVFGRNKAQDIILICGSGWRSATAASKLIENGYTKVWHVPDGYPGEEKIGINSDHAWRIAGLPWTTTDVVHGSSWHTLFCPGDGSGSASCRRTP